MQFHLMMSVFTFACWILVVVLITEKLYALQCELGTYHKYRKDGRERCKKCPQCNAGEGWNTSVEINVDAEHGYLECYQCVACLRGYYRPIHSASQTCNKCQLDCKRLNRYGSVTCGNDSPGHCGDCMPGFNAGSREPNDICFKTDVIKETTELKVPTPPIPQTRWTLDSAQSAILIVSLATVTLMIVGVLIVLIRWFRKSGTGQPLSSEEGLLHADKSIPVSTHDIDTDGPQPVPERPELWPEKEVDVLMATANLSSPSYHVVDRAIDKDDETLSMIATNISGKNVPIFFYHLHIHKSKIDPEEELWERGKINYANYILNVLVEWTKSACPFPSLVCLCDALGKACFHEVIEQILALEENHVVDDD